MSCGVRQESGTRKIGLVCRGMIYSFKKPFAALVMVGILGVGLDFSLAGASSREMNQGRNLSAVTEVFPPSGAENYSTLLLTREGDPVVTSSKQNPTLWDETLMSLVNSIGNKTQE